MALFGDTKGMAGMHRLRGGKQRYSILSLARNAVSHHKNWERAKANRDKFGAKVLEAVALERAINERATKLKNRGYTPRD